MKNNLRKALALLLCAAMGITLIPAAFADAGDFSFPDVSAIADEIAFPDPAVSSVFADVDLSFTDAESYDAAASVGLADGTGAKLVLPAGTSLIEEEAFANCYSMVSVTIPASVTEIGNRAFFGCLNLTDVFYEGTSAAWNSITIGDEKGSLSDARLHFKNGETWIPNSFRFFPDAIFRKYISYYIDTDKNGYLSSSEMDAVQSINCSGTADKHIPIQTLKGIEYFSNLKELYCVYNELPALDVSGNPNLEILYCQNNSISSLDLSKNAKLRVLSASSNKLSQLNIRSNPKLETVFAHYNTLKTLDTSINTELSSLFIAYNALEQLNLQNNTKLVRIELLGNSLSALNVSNNRNLTQLLCGKNSIRTLNVANNTNLQILDCHENALTSLNVSGNIALQDLNVAANSLTTLNVSKNTALERLQCYSNRLSSLTLGRNSVLQRLNCADNSISELDISLCPRLVNLLKTLSPVVRGSVVYYFENVDSPYLVLDSSVLLITGTVIDIPITAAYFPDATFRQGVRNYYDKNNDGFLSRSEINAVTSMYLSNMGIASLKGIEYFTALTTLRCFNNPNLNTLDISTLKNLQVLECYGTGIRALYLKNNPYLRSLVYDSRKEQQGSKIIYSSGSYLLSFPAGTVLYPD